MRPNFGVKWFEIDPTWQIIRLFAVLGIVKFRVVKLKDTKRTHERSDDEKSAPPALAA
jgi:fatty-acid desaturase